MQNLAYGKKINDPNVSSVMTSSVNYTFGETYEAEDGELFNGATINDCETCSGGKKVGNMGGDNQSYFTYDVEVSEAGTYKLQFSFTSGDPRSILISANGGTAIEVVCQSADWNTTGETEIEIALESGVNTIRFFNDTYAPDIDKFSLTLLEAAGDTVYEAEDGELFNSAVIGDCGTCSGGKKVGGMGGGGDNNGYFTYDVDISEAGTYKLPFSFISGDERSIFISANGGTAIEVTCTSADWSTTGETEIEIALESGVNTIRFSNDTYYAPDIDKFSLTLLEAAGDTVYEAEDGELFNSAVIGDCGTCSGGKKVGGMGGGGDNNGYFTYDVDISEAGTYKLPFSFISGDERSIFISANGGTAIEVACTSADWNTTGETEIEIALESGVNTIRFFNDTYYAPDIDKFSLTLLEATGDNVYEAEDGELFNSAVIGDCGTCSGGKKVSGMGGGGDNNGYFTYDVDVSETGTYKLPFSFISGDERSIFISANGGTAIEVACTSADWSTTGETEIEIELESGVNTIRFFNDTYYAPDIDKFRLQLKSTGGSICENCESLTYGQNDQIIYDTSKGTVAIYHEGELAIDNAYSEVINGGQTFSSKDYTNVVVSQEGFSDEIGDGVILKASLTGSNLPDMQQLFYTYSGKDYFLMEVMIDGEDLESNYMAPLVSDAVSLDESGDNRVIRVPYDNDGFVRYESEKVENDSRNVSSEVTAFYENSSRHGLVAGSVEHTVWKTGVETQGSGKNLNKFRIWGGYTSSEVTRDEIEHGKIKGTTLKSPKIFIGFYNDWRKGMEDYGRADKIADKRYINDWDKPTPFGWNSWGKIQTDLDLDKSKAVVDFFSDEIPMFRSGETAYIDLDSYWDNMVEGGLEGDFSKLKEFVAYCKDHNLKAGIYWAPFVDWGLYDRKVEGSNYNYAETWTDVNGGYHDEDGARAMDPTHPATKERINLVIDKFKDAGFEMIKIDFIAHASVEATSFYDPNVTTGMQAFKQGMEYLIDRIGDDMLVYAAISPNLATGRYVHMRRIACDAYADINASEYTLNSNTYGWWQSKIYDYIDGDLIVFHDVSIGENRARIASAIVNGPIITGDDFSSPGQWNDRAKELLQKEDILALARHGKAFMPVEGDSNRSASELFIQEINGKHYLAVFNYGDEKSYNISLSRLGLSNEGYCVKELFSGHRFSLDKDNFEITLSGKDAAIYQFNEGVNSCVFSLPDNYKILSTDVSCNGRADGEIDIAFENPDYTYQMHLEGEDPINIPANSSSYTMDNLTAGIYNLCFTIDEVPDYEQCFEIIIDEPGEISAVSAYNESREVVNLELKGAERFYVTLNGKEQLFNRGVHELKLKKGLNEISIKGDLVCQGSYFEKIYVSDGLKAYPNPTSGTLQIFVPTPGKQVRVNIYNMQGGLVKSLKLKVLQSKTIEIDISSFNTGTYLMNLSNDEVNETIKIIKK